MITYSFTVKNKKRLIQLQCFIRKNMPTARFKGNPYRYHKDDKYDVVLTYEKEDLNKLHVLTNEWHSIDNPVVVKKESFFKKIFDWFLK